MRDDAQATGSPWSRALRIVWGLFFVGSAAVNCFYTLAHPEFYRVFADLTFFDWYRELILSTAVPHARLVTLAVVVYEAAAGFLTLAGGSWGRIGLWATAAWLLFICPAMGWYTLGAPLLLVIPLGLLGLLWRHRGS